MMSSTLSANEAACVTGVPLKQVHRIIDAGLVDAADSGDGRSRAVHCDALVGLKLAHDTTDLITLDGRRRLVRYLLDHPEARTARERGVSVDVRAMKAEVRRGLSMLASARDAIECDEAVLSGTPCFKRTRIPVHDIADMLANGDSAGAIHEAFPQLSQSQIELAASKEHNAATLFNVARELDDRAHSVDASKIQNLSVAAKSVSVFSQILFKRSEPYS